jgi:tRNA(Ile)-lysidine synthase
MKNQQTNREPAQQPLGEECLAFDWTDRAVVVAVSGGADSVALLRILHGLEENRPRQLIVAHFNHRLRPGAEDDARFVADLARRVELPFELGQADVAALADEKGDGIEEAARDARYKFLEQVADSHRAHFVATGHTADDQAETVLHRILRGTGVAGLQGMQDARPLFGRQDIYLVRPLLGIRRRTLVGYLRQLGQPFCDDPTNADVRYTRNRIRHELLPLLERNFNPQVIEALLRLSETAEGAQSAVNELVEQLLEDAAELDEERQVVHVNREAVAGINDHVVRELFVRIWRDMGWPEQNMGLAEWSELALEAQACELYDQENDAWVPNDAPYKRMFPGRITAQKKGAELVLTRQIRESTGE